MNLLDLKSGDWSDEIVNAINLKKDIFPELHASTDIAGTITKQAAIEIGLP